MQMAGRLDVSKQRSATVEECCGAVSSFPSVLWFPAQVEVQPLRQSRCIRLSIWIPH